MSGMPITKRPVAGRQFRRYPTYKDSGVEWLGEIPGHWEVRRLKDAATVQLSNVDKKAVEGQESVRLCNYTDVYYHERISADMDFMIATATPEQARRFAIRKGDVLITKDSESWTDIAVPAVVVEDLPGVLCGYHLAHIRPAHDCHGPFLARAFSAVGPRDQFQIAANGITRFGLGGDAIATGVFAMPPEPEQRAIAAFLDRETARVDTLVAKKERLLELLLEQRTAIIEAAVASASASRETRLGYYVDLLPGYAFPSDRFSHDSDDVRLLRGVNISPDSIRWDDTVYWPPTESARYAIYQLREGDLVFGMDRPWISSGIRVAEVTRKDVPSLLLQRVARLRARHGLSQRFLKLVLSSPQFRAYFEPILTGISVPHVSPEQILSFRLRLPTLADQEAVCQRVATQLLHIGSMTDVLRLSIGRLREFRSALIAAAVTGQIDVRGSTHEP